MQQIPYTLDPATLQEQAAGVIQKLKAAGVTTVDRQRPTRSPRRSSPRRRPSRTTSPSGSTAVGAGRHERVRPHLRPEAVGARLRRQPAVGPVSPALVKQYDLHTWYFGDLAPAERHATACSTRSPPVLRGGAVGGTEADRRHVPRGPVRLAGRRAGTAGVHRAADHLRRPRAVARAPDFYGIDDFTEIWWDPTATGEDEIRREGNGMMRVRRRGQALLASASGRATSTSSIRPMQSCSTTSCRQLRRRPPIPRRPARRPRASARAHTQRVARCANSSSRSMMAKARCGTTSHIEWLVTKATMSARFAPVGFVLRRVGLGRRMLAVGRELAGRALDRHALHRVVDGECDLRVGTHVARFAGVR